MKTFTYRLFHFFLGWFFRLIFFIIPHGRKNEPKISDGPYAVCSNHMNAVDPIVICDVLRHQQPRYMAKKELFSKPVLGKVIKMLGAFPVDRSGRDAGALIRSVRMIENGCSIGVFPQGTRRPGIHPSKTEPRAGIGVICEHSHVTVLPVFLKTRGYRMKFLRPVHVYVGKPISYDEYTENGRYANDYRHISRYIFSAICSLDPDYAPDEDKVFEEEAETTGAEKQEQTSAE
ncbi:MAG: 1-acyl-sn-glycerol-3-phosphate acyltransferase [Clostridiales bacterium]|nr:1-acyl-sn-glycerol-3-phosphate acyltransferase [Clostridiales bacterium]